MLFRSEFGGSSNAYTENYNTVYYFNVLNDNLDIMVDIFSRFFIDPLFNINAVSREINAVNNEHLKNRINEFVFNANKIMYESYSFANLHVLNLIKDKTSEMGR